MENLKKALADLNETMRDLGYGEMEIKRDGDCIRVFDSNELIGDYDIDSIEGQFAQLLRNKLEQALKEDFGTNCYFDIEHYYSIVACVA